MKKLIFAAPALCMLMASCGGGDFKDGIDYYPVKEETDGKWGFVDKSGEMLLSDEFKNEPSVVVNGYFTVLEGDYTVLYKAGKKPELVKGCEELYSVGVFNEGIIPLTKKGERISLVDGDGKTLTTLGPAGGKEITSSAAMFSEGLLRVETEEEKYGYANSKGEYVISPKYDMAFDFSEGLAVVMKVKDDEYRYSVIDTKGEEQFSLKKDYSLYSYYFSNGFMLVKDNDRFVMLDKKGESIKLPGKVESVIDYNKDYIIFMTNEGKCGLMEFDDDFDIAVKAKYDSMIFLSGNKLLVSDDNEYSVINTKGDKEFDFGDDYKRIYAINGDVAKFVAYEGNYYVMLDKKGKPVNKNEFKDITLFPDLDFVYSDYFSVEGFVNDLMSNVTDNGIGNYYIGEPASKLGLEARDYTWTYNFNNSDLDKKGFRYNISFKGQCDETIARSEYNYGYYSSTYNYYINPDSQVAGLMLTGDVPSGYWRDIKAKVSESLKAKGYKLKKEEKDGDDDVMYFAGPKAGIMFGNGYNGTTVVLMVCSNNFISMKANEGDLVAAEEAIVEEVVADTVVAAY